MKSKGITLFVVMVIFLGSPFPMTAQEDEGLKERFIQRKPMIDEMKNQGIVGENNLGFLVFRGGNPGREQRQTLDEENGDRRIVYQRIAARLGTNIEAVGRRRAAQIAQIAAAGHWLQNAEGNWYQKR